MSISTCINAQVGKEPQARHDFYFVLIQLCQETLSLPRTAWEASVTLCEHLLLPPQLCAQC